MEKTKKITSSIWKLAWDIIFPPICVNCGTDIKDQSKFLCQNCFDEIQILSALRCPECGAGLANSDSACHKSNYVLAPASKFFPPIPALIHNFKYKELIKIGDILSAMVIVCLKNSGIELKDFVVTQIPLYPTKLRKRGFNQSEVMAKSVANYFSLPQENLLQRVKNNPQQAKQKDFSNRKENVKNCFQSLNSHKIAGKKIILVDDVSTSGATLFEASRVLKKYGAKKIIALVVAKA